MNRINIILDDSSVNPLPDDTQLTSGAYFPHDNDTSFIDVDLSPSLAPAPGSSPFLSNFDGTNPNGAWKPFIVDDASGVFGFLRGWSPRIQARVRRRPPFYSPNRVEKRGSEKFAPGLGGWHHALSTRLS
ncbi:MAG: hypothetical protein ACR2JR_09885 [Rubrobacteraceae bacterium]